LDGGTKGRSLQNVFIDIFIMGEFRGNIKAVFDQEPVFDGELKILEMNFAW
jgi:hypothetical protein